MNEDKHQDKPRAVFEKMDAGFSQKNATKQKTRVVDCVNQNKDRSSNMHLASEPGGRSANKRGLARLGAVQALYQMDIGGSGVMETVSEYETFRLGQELDGVQYLAADNQWFRVIVAGVVAEQQQLDPLIHQNLAEGWSLSRLDSTLRAILRAGVWEMKNRKDVPIAVVVNEYVDIAKAFFDGDEPKIVHAILDRLAKKLR